MNSLIVPADLYHADYVAAALRHTDRRTIGALTELSAVAAVRQILRRSHRAAAWLVDGVPACLFGVIALSVIDARGQPWLVGTQLLERHVVAFLRRSRHAFDEMTAGFAELESIVAEDNQLALRWANWLGFHTSKSMSLGGMDFRRIELRR